MHCVKLKYLATTMLPIISIAPNEKLTTDSLSQQFPDLWSIPTQLQNFQTFPSLTDNWLSWCDRIVLLLYH